MQSIKDLSGGTQHAFSFGVNGYEKGRDRQPGADGAAFLFEVDRF
jgi:hypothetical protein